MRHLSCWCTGQHSWWSQTGAPLVLLVHWPTHLVESNECATCLVSALANTPGGVKRVRHLSCWCTGQHSWWSQTGAPLVLLVHWPTLLVESNGCATCLVGALANTPGGVKRVRHLSCWCTDQHSWWSQTGAPLVLLVH